MDLSQILNNQYVVLAIAAAASLLIPGVRAFVQRLLGKINPSAPPVVLPAPIDPGPLPTNLANLLPWLLNQLVPQMRAVVKEEIANRPPVAGSPAAGAGSVAVVNNPDGSTTVSAPGVQVTSAAVKAAALLMFLMLAGDVNAFGHRRRCYCPPVQPIVQQAVRSPYCQCGPTCNCTGCCCDSRPGVHAAAQVIAMPVRLWQGTCGPNGCCR